MSIWGVVSISFHDIEIENIDVNGFTISIDALIKPVHALRMIKIDIPVPPRTFNKAMPTIYVKTHWYSPIKTSKVGYKFYFKNKYDRIGLGKYVFK